MGLGILCYILTEVKVNFVRSRASFVKARMQLRWELRIKVLKIRLGFNRNS